MDTRSLARTLAEIADTAAETLELQQVIDRVATCIRQLIPFDHMGVVRITDGDRAVLHATTLPCQEPGSKCTDPTPLGDWSPRARPRPGPNVRIDDADAELDPAFPMDAELLKAGVKSTLWEPFRWGSTFRGGVWLCAHRARVFSDDHQEILRPIAALLGSAVEHWRIWEADRRLRERLDQLEASFEHMAVSLDVREVFQQISDAVQPVLEHHLMVLTELDDRARKFRIVTYAGQTDIEPPTESIALTPEETERRFLNFEFMRDLPVDLQPVTARNRLMIATGMRSYLRVPVRLWGEVHGSLGFGHREPSRFGPDDAEVARRLADRMALVLSHQQLAEQARMAAEARESAERLAATVETLTRELEARQEAKVVGVSAGWKDALRQVGRVASSETTVLIMGESGTGKEVISRLIHQGSPRSGKPFVAINCAALPEQLLESELFGYERGAFTGAVGTKIGRLEQAAGGTLFLDEIAEMSPVVQAKLLRVLQEREFQRLGGARTLRADVRVIAATNRDLTASIARHEFREDLYYRLNVFAIHIPPLRERPDDVLPLADVFLEELNQKMPGRPSAGISRDAREWLLDYPWPGNVRELRNAIERAILLCDGGLITREHLPTASPARSAAAMAGRGEGSLNPAAPLPAGGVDLEAVERDFVRKALGQSKGNKSKAARLLRLTRAQLYSRLDKYGLS